MAKNDPRNEITNRSKAIEWWNEHTMFDKRTLSNKYFQRDPFFLTGREIEMIWYNECFTKDNTEIL